MTDAKRTALEAYLWRKGDLSHLLHSGQREARTWFYESAHRITPLLCSRRWGKSVLGVDLAIEKALSKPGATVRVAAPTAKMVKSIIEPHMRWFHTGCPADVKPKHYRQDGIWVYPNESIIQAFGCDTPEMADRGRGTDMDLGVIEEAGFVKDLRYVVQDVLLPQTLTTNGRIIMPSSPARTPAHAFTNYVQAAEAKGALFKRTIYEAPHIDHDMIAEYMEESGGAQSTTFRREYMCEIVVDENLAVVPEFSQNEDRIVCEIELPPHFDTYTVADFGYNDLTVVLFAYYDFKRAKIVVVDELSFQHTNSGEIAPAILEKEAELWGNVPPRLRIADCPLMLLADLTEQHGLTFAMARKDDKDAAVNALRLAMSRVTWAIHPRCKVLTSHLRHAIWNKPRKSYERSGEFGHFDAVDAAVYLERHVMRTRNPYPRLAPGVTHATHFIKPDGGDQGNAGVVRDMFRRRGSR